MSPLSLAFDWRMPKRFGDKLDQWGLPIIPNTSAYARPNMASVGQQVVPQFPVQLDASGSVLGTNNVTYNWAISNSQLSRNVGSSTPLVTTDLPEGTYNVTLTAAISGGPTLVQSGTIKVVEALIPVLDEVKLARENGDVTGPFETHVNKLVESLNKLGVEQYGEVGDEFDPNIHEALMQQPSDEVENPTLFLVMQPGYRIGDRILRPARVAVAEPDPNAPAPKADAANAEAATGAEPETPMRSGPEPMRSERVEEPRTSSSPSGTDESSPDDNQS